MVTRFPRHVWGPSLPVVKIQPVKKKLHGEQKKLRAVDEEENCQGRLQVQPSLPRVLRHVIWLEILHQDNIMGPFGQGIIWKKNYIKYIISLVYAVEH